MEAWYADPVAFAFLASMAPSERQRCLLLHAESLRASGYFDCTSDISIIISENRRERAFTSSKESLPIPMKAKLQTIECDAEDLIELPEDWIPVRLDLNGYATPSRKAYTLYYLRRA